MIPVQDVATLAAQRGVSVSQLLADMAKERRARDYRKPRWEPVEKRPEPVFVADKPPVPAPKFKPHRGIGSEWFRLRWQLMVEIAIAREFSRQHRRHTVESVLRHIARFTEIPVEDLRSDKRKRPIVRARQFAAWWLVRRMNKSLPEAGRRLGGRDHTTMLHSVRRVERLIDRRDETTLAWIAMME